ncbi:MAG TPA: 50S ribosomal protein L5 [Pirellulales bacterium]|jgi:large subunit ribosomal protein L5|nr:50S ribosomal protein L5 [Pirellulales bacterium]
MDKKPPKKPSKKAEAAPEAPAGKPPVPRLLEKYEKELLPALAQKFGRNNRLALPRLQKIIINMGVGDAITEKKFLEDAVAALAQIAGQKPVVTKSRYSIANFKLREGMPIGCKVTLRGLRMYEFLDRLVALALPRVRDFRGLSPDGFDGRGNYSLGLSEQLVFPELNPDKFTRPQGMNITIVISGHSNDESRELLRGFGMPFKVPEAKGKGAA